ncbi:MAG: multidrug resistance protein [Nanoarchaeota archaeon]|nr:multidrug resistance protein [Nanoarchaeota archaeon]
MDKWLIFLIVSFSILLNAFGQVSLKYGMNAFGGVDFTDLRKVFFMFFQPFVFVGLCLYVVSTIFWLVSLSNADLSFIYPLNALSFILVAFLARIVFKEYFSLTKLAGFFFVFLGAFLIGSGRFKT